MGIGQIPLVRKAAAWLEPILIDRTDTVFCTVKAVVTAASIDDFG
ncbi:hypothetical protein RESH_02726 [Rhodopirellula europaea SH398]|uniref:Uncharacterized protein n=1 Tax=Rhodopirellula europaea SH398 TaxID=1263868 RepID=M5S5D7_9BACT|nr:hypothetical protein RESH_02726 [Rhodopirellula europaea SH398]